MAIWEKYLTPLLAGRGINLLELPSPNGFRPPVDSIGDSCDIFRRIARCLSLIKEEQFTICFEVL